MDQIIRNRYRTPFDAWCVLNEFLSKLDPKEALETLRYYSLYSGDPKILPSPPPNYIEVHRDIFKENNGIYPWDIDVLIREVIYAAQNTKHHGYELRKWNAFSQAMNMLKDVENTIARKDINQSNILSEMFRLSHRQFPHQTDSLSQSSISRYAKIFTSPELKDIVFNELGLNYREFLTIGMALYGHFQQHAGMFEVVEPADDWKKLGISVDQVQQFFKITSNDYNELKSEVRQKQTVNNTFFYQYNPLSGTPLVMFKRDGEISYVCPSVNMLNVKITRGLYYDLINIPLFDQGFGTAFQNYIGSVIESTILDSEAKLYGEETDPSKNKRRTDWIIDQPKSFTLIECKTKRMAIGGYTILDTDEALLGQLSLLADAIVQTYQSYLIYRDVGYRNQVYDYDPNKNCAVCVVTLERWYLNGIQLDKLRRIVRSKLEEKHIDTNILNTVPFATLSADELERMSYLAKKGVDIYSLIASHNDTNIDSSTWEFAVHMSKTNNKLMEGYDYIFKDEFDGLFTPEAEQAFKAGDKELRKAIVK